MRTIYFHRALLGCLLLLCTAVQARAEAMQLELTARNGLYRATLTAQQPPVIGNQSDWTLTLTTTDGAAFVPRQVSVFGGMPAHGHGLPTEPAITRHLGGPDFLLQGLLFNMSGRWRIGVQVIGPSGLDVLSTEFDLQPRTAQAPPASADAVWSDAERAVMASLRLSALPPASDPSNALLGNAAAIEIGRRLFDDPGIAGNGKHTCASCHDAERYFTDGLARSQGSKLLARHAPSLIGSAHWDWFYWDGRRDSLWAQALTPIETPGEMDGNRTDAVRHLLSTPIYRHLLAQLQLDLATELPAERFPPGAGPYADSAGKTAWQAMAPADQELVNRWFAVLGKAIAAYETTLTYEPSRFDKFADAVAGGSTPAGDLLTAQEQLGLRLYLDAGKTQCLRCHNGPRFSNGGFHNVGTGTDAAGKLDFGRVLGVQAIWYDPFRCNGAYSDAPQDGLQPPAVRAQAGTAEQPARGFQGADSTQRCPHGALLSRRSLCRSGRGHGLLHRSRTRRGKRPRITAAGAERGRKAGAHRLHARALVRGIGCRR